MPSENGLLPYFAGGIGNMTEDNRIKQLQDAMENESITRELKDYISRLQEKLAQVRRLGGNYGRIDFSPYMHDIVNEFNTSTEAHPAIIETRGPTKRERSPKQPI